MTEWLGVSAYQDRLSAVHNALFWQARAMMTSRVGERLGEPQFGRIEGLTEDGLIVLSVSRGREWVRMAQPLAGIEIRDHYRTAIHLQSLRNITAQIDVYAAAERDGRHAVVVWVHQRPVNLMLVEDGLARPELNPETSITDVVYAAYYWRLAKGQAAMPERLE